MSRHVPPDPSSNHRFAEERYQNVNSSAIPSTMIRLPQTPGVAVPTTVLLTATGASPVCCRRVLPAGALTSRRGLEQAGGRMILGHGIDVADLGRVRVLLTKMEDDFLHSTFTATERETETL